VALVGGIGELIGLGGSTKQAACCLVFIGLDPTQLLIQGADLGQIGVEFGRLDVRNVGEWYWGYVSRCRRLVGA
jgi:hypothetical protein